MGGHQDLLADGQRRLPGHAHIATHRDRQRVIDINRTATHRHLGGTLALPFMSRSVASGMTERDMNVQSVLPSNAG